MCLFSSLLSGRISTLRDETGAVSIVLVASYLKSRTKVCRTRCQLICRDVCSAVPKLAACLPYDVNK